MPEVMDNLTLAWFPDHDIIRLVPDLTDFPFAPEERDCQSGNTRDGIESFV